MSVSTFTKPKGFLTIVVSTLFIIDPNLILQLFAVHLDGAGTMMTRILGGALHAAREVAEGYEFSPDTTWQKELEDSFPYEETPDQAQAIDQVKADMETLKPMDRLICGDVGYEKTEVALRAAFKTVNDGMQVGILVPTTVLAQQHYVTFSERLSPFPVRVEVLSRFRTHKEQQEVIEGLKDGSVDIVIGTHRLLQRDVEFKNLGLIVRLKCPRSFNRYRYMFRDRTTVIKSPTSPTEDGT